MIAPADFPPHPTKGRIMLDGYRNCLVWDTRTPLTDQEKSEAEWRKSIASYGAPWNPKVGQKWLDLKTNKVMLHQGYERWVFEDTMMFSSIPVEALTNYHLTAPPYPTGAELGAVTKSKTKPAPKIQEEPDPPKKSRVFTFE